MALKVHIDFQSGYALGLWKIEESEEDLYLKANLDAADEIIYRGYKNEKRRLEWLSARVLLAALLKKKPVIIYDDRGKPYLSDRSFHISISHTKDMVAAIVSNMFEVGIDVELVSDRIERIHHKFVSPQELKSVGENERLLHLYLHWCAKEAIYKIENSNAVDYIQNISILPFYPDSEGQFKAQVLNGAYSCKYLLNYTKYNNHVLVWTCR